MKIHMPAWCLECSCFITEQTESEYGFICNTCQSKLPFFDPEICSKCGEQHDNRYCSIEWATYLTSYWTLFRYEEPVNNWISSLKYTRNLNRGRALRRLLNNWIHNNQHHLREMDVLIPVPVHFTRLNKRGFNQAAYLVSSQKTLPVDLKILRKTKRTPQQTGTTRKARLKALVNSFEIKKPIEGRNVLLFDDVCTTGQTIFEISKLLKKKGAAQVNALTICRTINPI